MSRAITHRTSDADFNGKLVHWVNFGRVIAANSTQKIGWVAPCDGNIVQYDLLITTALTHATAAVSLGTEASVASLQASYDIHLVTAGYQDLTSSLAAVAVTKGTGYVFCVTSGDTTGVLSAGVVIEPV